METIENCYFQGLLERMICENLVETNRKLRNKQGSVDSLDKVRIRMGKLGKRMEELGKRMKKLG